MPPQNFCDILKLLQCNHVRGKRNMYIVPKRLAPAVSSKEDSDVRQTSGIAGSAQVILHSSESSSEPISGSNEVVGLLEECGHDEANAPDSPPPHY